LAAFLLAAQVAQQWLVTPEKSAQTFSTESDDSVEKVRNRRTRVLIALDLLLDLVADLVHFRFTSR